jgi:acetoin utilization deacetylase AcuC-like enzyme
MKVFYSPDYIAAAESFDTTRKSGWIADSLESDPIEGVEIVAPRSLQFDEIAAVHAPAYVTAVQTGEPRTLAESQGFAWDPGMWRSVVASTGGVVAAAIEAMSSGVAGSLSGGLHHARYDRGCGFCTFNGLAIAANAALAAGAESVLIMDVDAHCGGGTHSLIKDDKRIRQIDISVNAFDRYEVSNGNTLDMVRNADKYLTTIERRLADMDREGWKPALCLHNSGMDPDERCGTGGLRGITESILRQREEMVFEWFSSREIPIAFVLAGGYSGRALAREDLVALHRMTILSASTGKASLERTA